MKNATFCNCIFFSFFLVNKIVEWNVARCVILNCIFLVFFGGKSTHRMKMNETELNKTFPVAFSITVRKLISSLASNRLIMEQHGNVVRLFHRSVSMGVFFFVLLILPIMFMQQVKIVALLLNKQALGSITLKSQLEPERKA